MAEERTRHKKSTTLNIRFVEGVTKEENAMGTILKDLGCPNAEGVETDDGWNLSVGLNKCHIRGEDVMKFLKNNCPEVVIEKATKIKVELDDFRNKEHIEKLFEKITVKGKLSDYTLAETCIDWVGQEYISLNTTGNGVTATKVENLHRKNVLALKDKLVAHKLILKVDYTCRWEHLKSEECSV